MSAHPPSRPAAELCSVPDPTGRARPARTPGFVWAFRMLFFGGLGAAAFLGGPLGASLAIAAALLGLMGDRDGAVRHLLRSVAFVAALIAAPLYGAIPADWLVAQGNLSPVMARVLGTTIIFFALLILGAMLGRLAASRLRRRVMLGALDRVGGALLGGAEGALLVLTACWVLAAFRAPLAEAQARVRPEQNPTHARILAALAATHDAFARDPLYERVSRLSPLEQVPLVHAVHDVLTVAQEPQTIEQVADDPRMRRFMELPVVRAHLDAITGDERIRTAFQAGDLATVLTSPQFIAMLNDAALLAAVREHWDDLHAALGAVRP